MLRFSRFKFNPVFVDPFKSKNPPVAFTIKQLESVRLQEALNATTQQQTQGTMEKSNNNAALRVVNPGVPTLPEGKVPVVKTFTETDLKLIFDRIDMMKIEIERHIQPAPFRLNAMHFETNENSDIVITKIRDVLDQEGVEYRFPDTIATFFVASHPRDETLNFEIRIYKDSFGEGFIVEAYRFGGDGFLMHNVFGKIYREFVKDDLYQEEFNMDVEAEKSLEDDFNGLPLDYNRYDDLMSF